MPHLEPLADPISAVVVLFKAIGRPGMITGGVAVSLLGRPRFTADVDSLVILKSGDLPRLLSKAPEAGLVPRIRNPEAFARKAQVILLRHKKSGINVDISIGLLPFEEEAVRRSKVVTAGKLRFRIPTPEDLIIFKAVAHRPRDMEDIRSILQNHPGLDRRRIRRWVKQFAEALEMPEIRSDLEKILKGRRSRG